ncbi:14985_t:CDS:2 [Entrophospora sp. SA101]|nr:14985_t:CDS:2 [Entrophospora sp. SA101]
MVENNSNTKSIRQELLNKLKTIAEAKTELEQKIAEEIKSKSRNNNDKSSSKNTDRTISNE